MSSKHFLASVGTSQGHVEDVVARYLGRSARVSQSEYPVYLPELLISSE